MIYRKYLDFDSFSHRVKLGVTPENIYWDYKAEFNEKTPHKTAIDIASFANSMGGTILFGISEKVDAITNRKVANAIVGRLNAESIIQKINTNVCSYLYPTPTIESAAISVDEEIILAVNVDPSVSLISVEDKDRNGGYKYPVRTEFGNHFLKANEFEKRMLDNKSRRSYLKTVEQLRDRMKIQTRIYPTIKKFPEMIQDRTLVTNLLLVENSHEEFEIEVNGNVIRLPFSMINEIWNAANVGQSTCIRLDTQLFYRRTEGQTILEITG